MRSRISHLAKGRRMFGGVKIPPVLGGGVTPTWGQRSEQRQKTRCVAEEGGRRVAWHISSLGQISLFQPTLSRVMCTPPPIYTQAHPHTRTHTHLNGRQRGVREVGHML